MKCPLCLDPDLVIADRQGVEIDYCPRCRGVWLDRGELDKIIDRADRDQLPPPPPPRRNDDDDHRREYRGDERHYHQKKKSFWHELFD